MDREFIKIEQTPGGWQMLFQKLYQVARANAGSQLIAKKPMNVIRNRYRDVLPIDTTRVSLNDPDNDYINANFVKNGVGRTYILCQGPLQHTVPHFWQMIWEQNTAGVVMLNKCVERGMNKCFPYWPQPEDPPMDLGKFLLENTSYEDESSYRLTHLKLENVETKEIRDILHFHYTRWPDFGVPQNPDVFLDFLYAVRSSGVLDADKGPAVVHCSAGIGRSGTFCIVDTLLAKLEQTKDIASVNLQASLLEMRQQRLGLVQTADQLRFSYIAILKGALQDLELEPSNYDDLVEDEEEEDEEEDEVEESDSDELEDEDPEARMERKYPNLSKQTNSSQRLDSDDIPPPLPPRPPETLQPQGELLSEEEDSDETSPPPSPTNAPPPSTPPPPSSAPPGPPISPPLQQDEQTLKKIKLEPQSFDSLGSSEEEFGFKINSHSNDRGEGGAVLENGEFEVLEESGSENEQELDPPPIPPRSHSLSPSPKNTSYYNHGKHTGMHNVYDDDPLPEDSAERNHGTFLLEGRGEERPIPPLPKFVNGIINNEDEMGDSSPPLPAKKQDQSPQIPGVKIQEIADEELMLINELDLLEKMVDVSTGGVGTRKDSKVAGNEDETRNREREAKALKRKKLRDERRAKLSCKVRDIKEAMRQREGGFESDWSIPWLLVGFVVILGYCAYYIYQ